MRKIPALDLAVVVAYISMAACLSATPQSGPQASAPDRRPDPAIWAIIQPPCNPLPPGTPIRMAGTLPVRSGIRPPQKIVDVRPVSPTPSANGVVIIEVTIGIDGSVTATRLLRSVPGLDKAAIDAARQWRFTKTCLGGNVVPLIMTVTVEFRPEPAAPATADPRRVKTVAPIYPEAALAAGIDGRLVVSLDVRPDGTVGHVTFVRSVPALAKAVYDAVVQWTYSPALRDGEPVAATVNEQVGFSLSGPSSVRRPPGPH